jgi:tRNA pseudouridine38-40 synthase
MRYKATIQYDGRNYSGSQKQPNAKTIQGELEKTLCTLTKKNIKTVFSGRTDAGVSALAQVVHFDYDGSISCEALNELLPDDILVSDLKEAEPGFHAQKSAKSKHYRYVLEQEINVERAQAALDYLVGEHDFTSFKCAGTLNPYNDCFIESAITDGKTIDIIGNRFLYKMVRTIVGTLLFIEKKNLPAEHMKTVLEAKDRTKAGKTASPYGLTLIEVRYHIKQNSSSELAKAAKR